MEKNKRLLQLAKESNCFVWIDEQAGFDEDGLHYTTWYNTGDGVLVLRSALSPSDIQSVPWLKREQDRLLGLASKLAKDIGNE